jgi:hypothetical protein
VAPLDRLPRRPLNGVSKQALPLSLFLSFLPRLVLTMTTTTTARAWDFSFFLSTFFADTYTYTSYRPI